MVDGGDPGPGRSGGVVDPAGTAHRRLVHLATPDEWDAAVQAGALAPPSLATEGFVHLSTLDQAATTADRHFAGADELVLVVVDPQRLPDAVSWAESHPGEHFPHHHGTVPLDAVVATHRWRRRPQHGFTLPAALRED
ncbi:MAG: DUF952 domain-containing protein [Acidimicrobiales bacterium]